MILSVVIIDDKKPSIDRLEKLLELFSDVQVVGKSQDPEDGIRIIEETNPHLAFLDIEMPKLDGLDILKHFKGSSSKTRMVICTGHDQYMLNSFRSGVFDYLKKPVSILELKQCFLRFKKEVLFDLNEQEVRIIKLICKGLNSREIGEELFLAKTTIDSYRRNILEKTESKNSAALVSLFSSSF